MNQCVPSWDLDNNSSPSTARLTLHAVSNTDSAAAAAAVVADDSTLDYEVAELIWANGQLGLQGLGPPRIGSKTIPTLVSSSSSKYSWPEKPRAGGTLESIVSQAAHLVPSKSISHVSNGVTTVCGGGNQPAPWFNQQESAASAALPHPISMDALVPCSNPTPSTADDDDDDNDDDDDDDDDHPSSQVPNTDSSTPVGSCSTPPEKQATRARKRAKVAHEGSSKNNSPSASETFALDSISMRDPTLDTCDVELDVTSLGSRENTSTVKPWASSTKPSTVVGDDSVCHSRPYKLKKRESREEEERKKSQSGKSSVKTKRSRAADIHNQSERRRRDKINQRMKTLQKMIPNSSKTDKASMLDEVIEYLKQLQAQVQMMSRMIPQMMLPMSTMQQQLQMSMLAQMGMAGIGMGMGMGVMDMNLIARPNLPTIPSVLHPTAFMPLASWDVSGDHRTSTSNANMSSDPLSSFLACQSQSMTMDSYNRMAALFQQLHPSPTSNTKT